MATLNPDQAIARSRMRHRRNVFLTIVLPLLGGGLLIGVLMYAVIVLPRAIQVSLVADFTLLLFVLCPLVLCTLPFSIGLFVLAIMSGRLHNSVAKPLRRAESLSVTVSQRTAVYADQAARASIAFGARLAPLMNWLDRAFTPERPDEPSAANEDKP
jgi:hypothetical protein